LNFFDTNVLVAASIPDHPHHAACLARLAKLAARGGACAAHSLAEAYTTFTHASRYGMPPADALRIVDEASKTFTVISLTAKEYLHAIEAAALVGPKGPIVYDAVLLACARKIAAKIIYTNNVSHFRKVAPDLASRIVEP
jgi:predicted nucleic acid-binding protein